MYASNDSVNVIWFISTHAVKKARYCSKKIISTLCLHSHTSHHQNTFGGSSRTIVCPPSIYFSDIKDGGSILNVHVILVVAFIIYTLLEMFFTNMLLETEWKEIKHLNGPLYNSTLTVLILVWKAMMCILIVYWCRIEVNRHKLCHHYMTRCSVNNQSSQEGVRWEGYQWTKSGNTKWDVKKCRNH